MLKQIKEQFKRVTEWASNIFSLKQALYYDDDQQESWQLLYDEATTQKNVDPITLDAIRTISQYLYFVNGWYKGLVRSYVKYIVGKKFYVTCDNEKAQDAWNAWAKKYKWSKKRKEYVRRFFRDGEVFFDLRTYSFIEPECVQSQDSRYPYGIIKNQYGEVEYYSIRLADNSYELVEASNILHSKDTDENMMRGICYLMPLFIPSKQLNDWLNDRVKLNRVRAMVALLRKHKNTTPTNLKSFADARGTTVTNTQNNSDRRIQLTTGGVYDTSNIDYEFLAPNLQAGDVAEDGRNIGLLFSAMTGFPEFITRGDASNGNYSSTMIAEGPAEKEVEDWQDFFEDDFAKIFVHVVKESGVLDEANPIFSFPPIISRNAKEETDRNEILFRNGVISVIEWRRREQVDDEQMELEINGSMDV